MTTATGDPRPREGRSQNPVIAAGRAAIRGYGRVTASRRPDPDFLVIGAKRGGSTSFYYDLLEHPRVATLYPRPDHLPKATATKGVHFFDIFYDRGPDWYRSHLPSRSVRSRQADRAGGPVLTGEASPYYLFHPAAPMRAAALLPDVKIIAVLRDPVERTHSHWKERRRAKREELDFAAALAAEPERLRGVTDRQLARPGFYSYAHEQQSYAAQSEYDVGLGRWYDVYPREQILVLASEDYYAEPAAELGRAFDFLGLPPVEVGAGEIRNAAEGAAMDESVRVALTQRFAPHNERLAELVGRGFGWSR